MDSFFRAFRKTSPVNIAPGAGELHATGCARESVHPRAPALDLRGVRLESCLLLCLPFWNLMMAIEQIYNEHLPFARCWFNLGHTTVNNEDKALPSLKAFIIHCGVSTVLEHQAGWRVQYIFVQ